MVRIAELSQIPPNFSYFSAVLLNIYKLSKDELDGWDASCRESMKGL